MHFDVYPEVRNLHHTSVMAPGHAVFPTPSWTINWWCVNGVGGSLSSLYEIMVHMDV